MTDFDIINNLINQTSFGGSTFLDGVREGDFLLNTESNLGVATGIAHQTKIDAVQSLNLITQVTVPAGTTANTVLYAELAPGNTPINMVDGELAIKINYACGLVWLVADGNAIDGKVIISGYDQYLNKMCVERTWNQTGGSLEQLIDVGILYLSSIAFVPSADVVNEMSYGFVESNFVELPYTDYGFAGNLNSAIYIRPDAVLAPLNVAYVETNSPGAFGGSYFTMNRAYLPATWKENIKKDEGRARPLLPVRFGTDTDAPPLRNTDNSTTIVVSQSVFGFKSSAETFHKFGSNQPLSNAYDPNLGIYPGDFAPSFETNYESVYGRLYPTDGWTGWKG